MNARTDLDRCLNALDAPIAGTAAGKPDEEPTGIVRESRAAPTTSGIVSGATPLPEVTPWPESIDPAALLNEISATIRRFIVCSHETANAAALWVAMTWFMDAVQVAPLAVITAPEKRCGKTLMLSVLGLLSCRPLTASNITPAALFRCIDAWQPTVLIDEADAFMKENEELRGLINCGHTRDSAYVVRTVGKEFTPTQFNVWSAKAIAGIGKLADTLMDRAIVLELRRKLPTESVERFRSVRGAEPELFKNLSAKLARFAMDYFERVRCARPELPDELHDRAQDNWEPLLQIALVAGGDWPRLANNAALKLSDQGEQSKTIGVELLSDIQEIFEHTQEDRIFSADLIKALCDDGEKPWAGYNKGFPIKPAQISKHLREYGICSKTIRMLHDSRKGYLKEQFDDAFARYVFKVSIHPAPDVTPSQANEYAGLAVTPMSRVTAQEVTSNNAVTRKPTIHEGCDGVTANAGNTAYSGAEEEL
jgi:putative DNA primase/helicase